MTTNNSVVRCLNELTVNEDGEFRRLVTLPNGHLKPSKDGKYEVSFGDTVVTAFLRKGSSPEWGLMFKRGQRLDPSSPRITYKDINRDEAMRLISRCIIGTDEWFMFDPAYS